MSTRAASLDCSPAGALRVTSWYATPPAFVFGPGTVLDDSISVDPAELSQVKNKVVIEADHRFSRLRQRNEEFSWVGGGFCDWYFTASKELPTVAMVEEAVEAAGGRIVGEPVWAVLPPSDPDPCDLGVVWVNRQEAERLLLSASFKVGRRWVQSVTESYELSVVVEESIEAVGEQIERIGSSMEVESLTAETWAGNPFSDGGTGHQDERDETRRGQFLLVLLHQAAARLIAAHRETTVTWSVPTPLAADLDLVHTLELDDVVKAVGKCVRIVDRLDPEAGTAITTLTIKVMRGGGDVNDRLDPPPYVDEPPPTDVYTTVLPTQLGKRAPVPEYDDELLGFAGNYTTGNGEEYPRRFDIELSEIDEDKRDDLPVPITATYRVAISNDKLEL